MTQKYHIIPLMIVLSFAVSACAKNPLSILKRPAQVSAAPTNLSDADLRPQPRPDDLTGDDLTVPGRRKVANTGQTTVAAASQVTVAELEQAKAKPVGRPERNLGKTIASLGLIDETGFWLRTPLVSSEANGRVVFLKTGTAINLTLIPNAGAKGSGSQISIAAMKVLGISIVDLAELQVFMR
ncbi:MAG: hypothetical protein COB84_08070 [Rhodobacteraceae bacterium]|nr:MAG: hypothetical protein COB84_08070 [Paracoccaceae bacterium]